MTTKTAVAMNFSGVRGPRIDGPQGDAIPFFHEGRYHLYYLEAPAEETRPARPAAARPGATSSATTWNSLGRPRHRAAARHTRGGRSRRHLDRLGGREGRRDPSSTLVVAVRAKRHRPSATRRAPTASTSPRMIATRSLVPTQTGSRLSDWRDPFVFWREDRQEYWMLVTAPATRRR